MLTFFTTAKAFVGHSDVIQRNALKSWKLVHPDVEVIVFGDDAGAAEVCRELGLRHEPRVAKNTFGTNRVDDMFARAQELSRHRLVCYVNCDIVLTREFAEAARRVEAWRERFLMVGRRWDTEVTTAIDFSRADWDSELVKAARTHGYQRAEYNIDYFLFSRGLFATLPPLAIGRFAWDNYLVWNARAAGEVVVDVSEVVPAIHQNHDYGHYPGGMQALWHGDEAKLNLQLAGHGKHRRTIDDAQYLLTGSGVVRHRWYWLAPAKRRYQEMARGGRGWLRMRAWHPFLDATRRVRHAVGLHSGVIPPGLRSKKRRHWQDAG
jgi:hypothetical protein